MRHSCCLTYGKISVFLVTVWSPLCLLSPLFSGPKTVQASVTLLEQLPVYSECSGSVVLHHDILPMLYLALESSMSQVKNMEFIN